jgi:hypothetical protein
MTIKDFAENVLYTAIPSLKGITSYGFINKNKAQTVGLYERRSTPVNTYRESSYLIKQLTILVHWSKSSTECELKAEEIANALDRYSFEGGWVDVDSPPIDVGRDENEVFERTIDITIYYERS